MSDIKSKIIETQKAKKIKSEFVATTVRIPTEIQSVIEDLAEYLSISKQDVMLDLIKEGIKIVENVFADDEINDSISTKFHVLNTNKRHDSGAQKEMLSKGIAAAFYGKWKRQINKIQKNDTVFLYENGVGIVAYGKGSGETLTKDYDDKKDECHYQDLNDFVVLENPLSAAKIKKILDRNVAFLQTRSSMPDGQKILDAING